MLNSTAETNCVGDGVDDGAGDVGECDDGYRFHTGVWQQYVHPLARVGDIEDTECLRVRLVQLVAAEVDDRRLCLQAPTST